MRNQIWQPEKIISGGQTGADFGGLRAGEILGIPTGGWAAKGWLTENGPQPVLGSRYRLFECSVAGYPARTKLNVTTSDYTIIFYTDVESKGTELTLKHCWSKGGLRFSVMPLLRMDALRDVLINDLNKYQPKIINIAGNRESKSPGIHHKVIKFLVDLWGENLETFKVTVP